MPDPQPSSWREGRLKKKPRFIGHDSIELVAAGFETPREHDRRYSPGGGNDRGYNQGGGSGYRGDGSRKREWRRRILTDEEELEQPCRHHMFKDPETGITQKSSAATRRTRGLAPYRSYLET